MRFIPNDLYIKLVKMDPADLWQRWGYICVNTSDNERKIYENVNGQKGKSIYRSYFSSKYDMWLHSHVNCDRIAAHDIPGNENIHFNIPQYVTTNIILAIVFERKRLFENNDMSYRNFDQDSAVDMLKPMCGNPKNTKYIDKTINQNNIDIFDNKRKFLMTCNKGISRELGLAYLKKRNIGEKAAEIFEKAKILYYNGGSHGKFSPCIAFCGWREITEKNGVKLPLPINEPAFINKRLLITNKQEMQNQNEIINGLLPFSQKIDVPFLKGKDESLAIFVEGGVDMLSIAEICLQNNIEMPSIIMTAGYGNQQILGDDDKNAGNAKIINILKKASRVVFIGENDDHLPENKRNEIKSCLEKNLKRVYEINPSISAQIAYPCQMPGCKDANDMLKPEYSEYLYDFIDLIFNYEKNKCENSSVMSTF